MAIKTSVELKAEVSGGVLTEQFLNDLIDSSVVESGTYNPTLSSEANTTIQLKELFSWYRYQDFVYVRGFITFTVTAAYAPASFEIGTPIYSNFTTSSDAKGIATPVQAIVPPFEAKATAATNKIKLFIDSGITTTSVKYLIDASYEVK